MNDTTTQHDSDWINYSSMSGTESEEQWWIPDPGLSNLPDPPENLRNGRNVTPVSEESEVSLHEWLECRSMDEVERASVMLNQGQNPVNLFIARVLRHMETIEILMDLMEGNIGTGNQRGSITRILNTLRGEGDDLGIPIPSPDTENGTRAVPLSLNDIINYLDYQ